MNSKAFLTWALNKDGDMVHVDEVPNGNECGCICPHCKSSLCAKNGGDGERMIHHFAHLSGADCIGAVESALHKMAKEIMLKSKCVYLPNRYDGRQGGLHHFDQVEVEFYDKDTQLRPDCIGYNEGKCLWIEFKRTHAVDTKKKGKIISAHIDCIEIDLNGCNLDPIEIKEFITNSAERRIWIRDVSAKKRSAGHASGDSYCDRYDYGDEYLPVNRTYAKDEDGKLVNLVDDDFDLNKHTYYCLACGQELTVDVDNDGIYGFVHVDYNNPCRDDYYLHEAAKEILYERFYSSDKFIISVPQYQTCSEKSTCQFYNTEECVKDKSNPYDLKGHGYVECLKDYKFPNNQYRCDLVIKQKESLDNAIIISLDAREYHVDVTSMDHRIIELTINDDYSLESLRKKPIGESGASFINFKRRSSETISFSEIERGIEKFELFSSGKCHMGIEYCSEINKRKRSTVFEVIFAKGAMSIPEARAYSLYKCLNRKKKACYCEICFFCSEINSYGMTEKICKLYKKQGTPHYPLRAMQMDCPHFSLNRNLISNIEREYNDVVVIERDIEPVIG